MAISTAVGRVLDQGGHRDPAKGLPEWKKSINSHSAFTHDSIDSLGYDWERISNPGITPNYPLKVYLPQTTEDIVTAVKEVKALGQKLAVRAAGHSSNDLVLSRNGGPVLLTAKLDDILAVDEQNLTATVQGGAVSANIDDALAQKGLGLPVIGDHNHVTVGGFASVGGISPASHRFGMFVDNVVSLEYVNWDGEVVRCSREDKPDHFFRVLGGLGREGVIATLTVRIIRVDKYSTVLENRQRHFRNVNAFIKAAGAKLREPGEALYERGVWVDLPLKSGRTLRFGQFSAYHATEQTPYKAKRDRLAYNALHGLGYVAGRLPRKLDRTLKTVGQVGVIFSPKYATSKNVEFFADKILDSTVGEPSRMFIILAPLDHFDELFRRGYELMLDYRRRFGCFSVVSAYVKSIRSDYLAAGTGRNQFSELLFFTGITEKMGPELLDEIATKLDDLTIEYGGFRYMHTRTSRDPERLKKIDPSQQYLAVSAGKTMGAADEP
ncbi:MAG TPA: FAD-binding oxidoreductase [Actinomycetota bacterium]|nr:FAD-binding oxidoreductase [Actinomycetota bacterium]